MLSYFDLRKGVIFIYKGQPHQVLEFLQVKKAQREGIGQTKLKNLVTGEIIYKSFHQSEKFEEAEIEKVKARFLYEKNAILNFVELESSKSFSLSKEKLGVSSKFLKKGMIVDGLKWQHKIINVSLPIKVQLKVVEAPPHVKTGRESPGTKSVVLENGTKIQVPVFIEVGDIIEVNTETGEYVRRVSD